MDGPGLTAYGRRAGLQAFSKGPTLGSSFEIELSRKGFQRSRASYKNRTREGCSSTSVDKPKETTSVDKPKETSTKATLLRIIDWFVTNYAKKHPITLKTDDGMHFNVYINYRSQLKAYSKHQFDPFRRRFRINYYYDKDKFVETTIGQLNFFKWLIEYNVLAYIQAHHEEIESDMTSSQLKPRDAVSAAVVGDEVDVDEENEENDVEEVEKEKKNKNKGCGGGGDDEPNRVPHQHQRMNKVDGVRRLVFS